MTTLQTDLLEIYNSLVSFSEGTITSRTPKPIKVSFEVESRNLRFEQAGTLVLLGIPNYYCLALEDLVKPSYLLPADYDNLMSTLQELIGSGELLKDRTCLSPENFGFDIYGVDMRRFEKGPDLLGSIRFVSGDSWWFKFKTRRTYDVD